MINAAGSGDSLCRGYATLKEQPNEPIPEAVRAPPTLPLDFQALYDRQCKGVWRTLRRLGVPPASLDDATQQVFLVAFQRSGAIDPERERAFLLGVAARIAARVRRTLERRQEVLTPTEALEGHAINGADLSNRLIARSFVDAVLASFPEDARTVFVLFELEGMTLAEISGALEIPQGTAASRLRRARALFHAAARRLDPPQEGTSHG